MTILSDIFQKNQQIKQNPMSVVRSSRQQAYDNLLNKQYDIEEENKKYDKYNNLSKGIGGLTKILTSAFIKDPIQQAGAMNGISEQEERTDALRQAYEQSRQNQNKDYVQQAKEQLAMAISDEDKALDNDWKQRKFAYEQSMDDTKNNQWDKEFDLKNKLANAQIENLKMSANNKPKELSVVDKKIQEKKGENFVEDQKNLIEATNEYEQFKNLKKELLDLNKQSPNSTIGYTGQTIAKNIWNAIGAKDFANTEAKGLNAYSKKQAMVQQKIIPMIKKLFPGAISDKETERVLNMFGQNGGFTDQTTFANGVDILENYLKQIVDNKKANFDSLYNDINIENDILGGL